ncbi:MAG TPA: TIGR03118 family protein [Opitutaceae bacterium]|nr:TIGR03118 family protein [Opitutaceae bacterium]
MKNSSWLRSGSAQLSSTRGRALRVVALTICSAAAALGVSAKDRPSRHYQQTNLVSDLPNLATVTDPHLVNPWGLAASAAGPWWVADNGTGLSTLYNGAGAVQSLVVTVPKAVGSSDAAAPTGIVFNSVATDFLVGANQPARFIFATEEGTISGWNSGPNAVLKVTNPGAVYKGLTLAAMNGANFLYAANFGGDTVDVFDRNFAPVALGEDAFRDRAIPGDYAPFNVQRVGDAIYVTFAKKEAGSIDELHGPGRGLVDVFSPDGVLRHRLRWGPWFNAPWGVVRAPADFGAFSDMILVGQFGSGKIAAFDPESGEFRGLLRSEHGRALSIEGLWALAFGNGASAGATNTLFFTAGIEDEAHGLFGTITPAANNKGDDENNDKESEDDQD